MDPSIVGTNISVRLLHPADAAAWLQYKRKNRAFFTPYQPLQPDSEFTLEKQHQKLEQAVNQADSDTGYLYGVFTYAGELMGHIQLSGIARGPFQNAYLGYAMDESCNGRGWMTEALGLVLNHAFDSLTLHRVQAAVMPRNSGSIRVLEKLGFVREGCSRRYLKIHGEWEDHYIYALLADDARKEI